MADPSKIPFDRLTLSSMYKMINVYNNEELYNSFINKLTNPVSLREQQFFNTLFTDKNDKHIMLPILKNDPDLIDTIDGVQLINVSWLVRYAEVNGQDITGINTSTMYHYQDEQ